MSDETSGSNAVELATELTVAWLHNRDTRVKPDKVISFLGKMYEAVTGLTTPQAAPADTPPEHTPAVTARKSLASKDHIISMVDGKPYKTLRRHLSTHGMTPEQYRERYSLKADYPMVAESYSEARRAMAKEIGLGRKPGAKMPPKATAKPAAKTGTRQPKAQLQDSDS